MLFLVHNRLDLTIQYPDKAHGLKQLNNILKKRLKENDDGKEKKNCRRKRMKRKDKLKYFFKKIVEEEKKTMEKKYRRWEKKNNEKEGKPRLNILKNSHLHELLISFCYTGHKYLTVCYIYEN